ncbi:response regulator [Solirubrobacter soli]|uniref:response regulator n=1 Tax=Solirubrobacter soli TaxID=363832 RepID=UPI000409DAC6|nr:response regulator [Solirubrobacter soli]
MKVLLIDDEPDIRAIAKMALERIGGHTVTAAGSAGEAVAAATAERPDAVLLDVMMPDVDGPATLVRLRTVLGQEVPVIFLTAKAQAADIDRLKALGAIGVIAKPFDPLSLPGEVGAIIGC